MFIRTFSFIQMMPFLGPFSKNPSFGLQEVPHGPCFKWDVGSPLQKQWSRRVKHICWNLFAKSEAGSSVSLLWVAGTLGNSFASSPYLMEGTTLPACKVTLRIRKVSTWKTLKALLTYSLCSVTVRYLRFLRQHIVLCVEVFNTHPTQPCWAFSLGFFISSCLCL